MAHQPMSRQFDGTEKEINVDKFGTITDLFSERVSHLKNDQKDLESDKKHNANRELKKMAVALLTDDESEAPETWNRIAVEKMFNADYIKRLKTALALIAAEIDRCKSEESAGNDF